MHALGIDVGGSGIKGAPVDTATGTLTAERFRIPTPQPATPEACAKVIQEIVTHFAWDGPVGVGFPGVVLNGVVKTAANIAKSWVDVDAATLLKDATGCPFFLANDADVAGLAEMRFGAGKDKSGLVIVVTIGTGLGTALFIDGHLVPNCELGHLELNGREAEQWASDAARKREDLSRKKWMKRLNVYLNRMHAYFWPELFILGGGASKKWDKLSKHLDLPCDAVPAQLLNEAGIVGAALLGQKEPN